MKTTTVRFDTQTWNDIAHHAKTLKISHAEFIRGAVHQRIGRHTTTDRIDTIEQRLDRLDLRLNALTAAIRRITMTLRS